MNKKYQKYIDYIVNDIELPYLKSLEQYGLTEKEYDLVLGIVFNQPVKFVVSGDYQHVYDKKGNLIYREDSNGYWEKYEYDKKGNLIYREDSNGYWEKYEYDNQGNRIYIEDSDGYWIKYEYDNLGNRIYYENSNGDWIKREYDEQGNRIYYEDSNGEIDDNR
jgi:YD repeat-containing protein